MTTPTLGRDAVARQFSDQLHYLRARRARISQREFATAVGVSVNTVSAWENGRSVPHLEVIERLADYFRTTLADPSVEFRFSASPRQ